MTEEPTASAMMVTCCAVPRRPSSPASRKRLPVGCKMVVIRDEDIIHSSEVQGFSLTTED